MACASCSFDASTRLRAAIHFFRRGLANSGGGSDPTKWAFSMLHLPVHINRDDARVVSLRFLSLSRFLVGELVVKHEKRVY